jgi:hypothetical protein
MSRMREMVAYSTFSCDGEGRENVGKLGSGDYKYFLGLGNPRK